MKQLRRYVLAAALVVGGALGLGAAPSAQAGYPDTVYYSGLADFYEAQAKYHFELALRENTTEYDYYTYLYAEKDYENSYYAYLYAPFGSITEFYALNAFKCAEKFYQNAIYNYVYGGGGYDYEVADNGYCAQYYRGVALVYAAVQQ